MAENSVSASSPGEVTSEIAGKGLRSRYRIRSPISALDTITRSMPSPARSHYAIGDNTSFRNTSPVAFRGSVIQRGRTVNSGSTIMHATGGNLNQNIPSTTMNLDMNSFHGVCKHPGRTGSNSGVSIERRNENFTLYNQHNEI